MTKIETPQINIVESIKLPPKKTAIIVVDMQNDFANPNGALYVPGSEKIIPTIKQLVTKARNSGALIVYTQDSHMENDIEFNIWPKHTVKGSWGWKIVDELTPEKSDIIIEKLRYDAFFGTPLDHILRIHKIDYVVVTGVVANICVLHTASSAALRGYKVILPKDTTVALNEFDYLATLRQVDFLYKGIIIEKAENIEFQ